MIRRQKKERLIDDSAFAIQRAKPHEPKPDAMFRSAEHKAWIQSLPCDRCGRFPPSEGAHLRLGTQTAKGETPHDFWLWPGCHRCHRGVQHQIGEPAFWCRMHGIVDPNRYVLERYGMRSTCPRTQAAATAEYHRRYGAPSTSQD